MSGLTSLTAAAQSMLLSARSNRLGRHDPEAIGDEKRIGGGGVAGSDDEPAFGTAASVLPQRQTHPRTARRRAALAKEEQLLAGAHLGGAVGEEARVLQRPPRPRIGGRLLAPPWTLVVCHQQTAATTSLS
jgi:hypothetical protein